MNNFALFLFLLIYPSGLISQSEDRMSFAFGSTSTAQGFNINAAVEYDAVRGFGFDFNTSKKVIFHKNAFTTTSPVYFSIRVPEGNFKITLVLGSDEMCSKTTVKAESRRLFLNQIKVDQGQKKKKSFVVNVRTPNINSEEKINLKPREASALNWDDKLTLEFSGEVALRSIEVEPVDDIKTLYLAGDSTVTDQDLEPWASWGQMITQYFQSELVVANYAASGESLNSFKARKRLEKVLSLIKPDDYLLIEFGHNDEKEKGEGKGPWQSYTNLLIDYIQKTREKGGIPILATPTQRRFFSDNGTLRNTHGEYPKAMRDVAEKLNVPLIDLTEMTSKMYESWGDHLSRKAFVQYPAQTFPGQKDELKDNTHFNSFGANEVALAVLQGIRESKNLALKEYIKSETPKYNPKAPNQPSSWTTPMSSRFENKKPDGY